VRDWLVRGPYVAWPIHLDEEKRNMTENNEQLSDLRASTGSEPITTCMKYYDLKKNRHRVRPHLADKKLNDILVKDFNKFTFGRWNRAFTYSDFPYEFETCDRDSDHRGRRPAFWRYVKLATCHWLVNSNLRLAMLAQPKKTWRIITSEDHSTVWDGEDTLFDFNFQAFGIEPDECFDLAFDKGLKPGKYLRVYFAEHYTVARIQSRVVGAGPVSLCSFENTTS
jgi:hypothetical protein